MKPEAFRWRERDIDNALIAELASYSPSEARIRELVENGANVNSVQEYGDSALMQAISFLQDGLEQRFIHLLVELGANVNYLSDEAGCPLWEACLAASPTLIEYLLEKGANPNAIVEFSETIRDWTEVDQCYHEMEARGDAISEHAKTARELTEVVAVLKRHGAKNLNDLCAARVSGWLHVFAAYRTGLLTRDGHVDTSAIEGLPEHFGSDFRAWKEAFWDSWPNKDWSDRPSEFDREAHNDWGRRLCQTLRSVLPQEIKIEYLSIKAEDEKNRIRNVDRETIA